MHLVTGILLIVSSAQLGILAAAMLRTPQWPYDGQQALLSLVGFSVGAAFGVSLLSEK